MTQWTDDSDRGSNRGSLSTWWSGMGREIGGRLKTERTYVYLWLIYVEVWQKTTKFCKAIILQLQNKKNFLKYKIFLSFSINVVSDSLWPFGLQHTRLPCPSLSPRVSSNSCTLSWWCYPSISSSATTLLLLHSIFPSIRVFSNEYALQLGRQSIGALASATVFPMNAQGWFPLGLTSLISLQSKGPSRVLSSNTIQKHQFFGAQPSLWSNSHICTWLLEKP